VRAWLWTVIPSMVLLLISIGVETFSPPGTAGTITEGSPGSAEPALWGCSAALMQLTSILPAEQLLEKLGSD